MMATPEVTHSVEEKVEANIDSLAPHISDNADSDIEQPDREDICHHFSHNYGSPRDLKYRVSELQRNARGCDFCAVILAALSTVLGTSLNQEFGVEFKLKGQFNIPPRITYQKQGDFSSQQRFEVAPFSKSNNLPKPIRSIWPFQDVASDSSGEACVKRIKSWMNNCENVHPFCDEAVPSALPKRVIDVNNMTLYESNGEQANYITLSHCWGGNSDFKTEQANIMQRLAGLSWNELPKTFQDAITLTRALEVRYLWIDSLCIIQDSRIDWEVESAKMNHIYKNSYLTIAASLAAGDHEGFLRPRTEGLTLTGTVKLTNNVEEHFKVRRLPEKHYRRDVGPRNRSWRNNMTVPSSSPQPLETRAWSFQERLVSQRLVSFCHNEMEWDCVSLSRCECETRMLVHDENFHRVLQGQEPVPGKSSIRSLYQSMLCLAEAIGNEADDLGFLRDIIRRHWRELLVPSYSLLKLTKPSDRLPALSAIAYQLQETLQDDYLAGVWRADLTQGLTWIARSFGTVGPAPGWKPQTYRAPSWSWASIEGAVDSPRVINANVTYCIEVEQVDYVPAPDNLLGSAASAILTIRGDVVPATISVPAVQHGVDESKVEYKISSGGGHVLSGSFYPDTPLIEHILGSTIFAGRSFHQPGEPRDSMSAEVLCLVVAGLTSRRFGSFVMQSRDEETSKATLVESGDRYAQFERLMLIVLGKSSTTAGSYERLGLMEGVSVAEVFEEKTSRSVTVV